MYVDPAVVESTFGIRFDAGFDANRPDRAEFIYGKCLCFTAFGQDGASPGPTADLDSQQLELSWEHAFTGRFSLFVEVPFRSVDIAFPPGFEQELVLGSPGVQNSGLGDVRGGVKYALIAKPRRYLTLQLRYTSDTGEAAEGLGTGHDSIEPAVLFQDAASPRLAMFSELRWHRPLGGSSDPLSGASIPPSAVGRLEQIPSFITGGPGLGPDDPVRNEAFAGDVLRFGFGMSYEAGGSRLRWAPVAELVWWYVFDGFTTPPEAIPKAPFPPPRPGLFVQRADGDTIINLKLSVWLDGRFPGSVALGYGLALTGEDAWYEGVFRLVYRYAL